MMSTNKINEKQTGKYILTLDYCIYYSVKLKRVLCDSFQP